MKVRIKWLQLVLVFSLVFALILTGCQTSDDTTTTAPAGGDNGDGNGDGDRETIDITVSLWDIEYSFPGGDPDEIAVMVSDMFDINLTSINVGWGDADEKYNTWAASGQLPDIIGAIAHVGQGRYFQWINDGVVRALPDDLSAYPVINQIMQQDEVLAFQVDGNNYFLPRQTYEDSSWWAMDRGLLVRKDWMENLGISDPVTEQDYIDLTVAFATQDPNNSGSNDTVGLVPSGVWILTSQGLPGFGYTDGRWVLEDDGYIRPAITSERTLRLMEFVKEMYQAGGLDPDFATLDNALEKFAAGQAGILARQVSSKHLKAVLDMWVTLQPDVDFFESVSILRGPSLDGEYTRFTEMAYWSESYFNVNVEDDKMGRILELYDWLYSDEGMRTMMWGIEGTDWEMDDGEINLLTDVNEETGLHTPTAEIYPFTYAMSYLAAWTGDLVQYIDPAIPQGIRDMASEELDHRLANWQAPDVDWAVQAINVPEKQEIAGLTYGDDWVRFIMDSSGKDSQTLYEEMVANWNANGLQDAVEAVTNAAREQGLID